MVKIFSPALPCKHHIQCDSKHSEYGKCVEVIESKKLVPMLKFLGIMLVVVAYLIRFLPNFTPSNRSEEILQYLMPIIITGYGLYFLIGIGSKVYLYEYGIVYKTLFSEKEYSYNALDEISLKYDKQYDRDSIGKSFLWRRVIKNSYMYYELAFSIKHNDDDIVDIYDAFVLKLSVFSYIDEKMKCLKNNLLSV